MRTMLELFGARWGKSGISHDLRTVLGSASGDRKSLMEYAEARSTYRGYYFLIAVIIFMMDQATKSIVARSLPLHETITVIPGFFSISHVLNRGAAFSLFADSTS